MAEITPELVPQVLAAIGENAEEAAGAMGRALDGEFVLKAGEPITLAEVTPAGGGLIAAFGFAGEGMIAWLSAASGLVPDWTKEPDATGESKLSTLAQELSMLLVPDSLMADDFKAVWVDDLAAAVAASGAAPDAPTVPIEVAQGETLGVLSLVWPAPSAMSALEAPSAETQDEAPETAEGAAEPIEPAPDAAPRSRVLRWNGPPPQDLRDLPPNTLSALQVEVPLSVNLAGKKMRLNDVVELGPGSIISFDKGCDDPLEVAVGSRPVALGEAVKIGERFGVRIREMILPEEHFRPMLPPRAG